MRRSSSSCMFLWHDHSDSTRLYFGARLDPSGFNGVSGGCLLRSDLSAFVGTKARERLGRGARGAGMVLIIADATPIGLAGQRCVPQREALALAE